jgi:hypothetical protein
MISHPLCKCLHRVLCCHHRVRRHTYAIAQAFSEPLQVCFASQLVGDVGVVVVVLVLVRR